MSISLLIIVLLVYALCIEYTKDSCNQLSESSLDLVYDYLSKASSDWYEIGICLGVPIGSLKAYKKDVDDVDTCLRKMLMEWLHEGHNRTWHFLAEVLSKIVRPDLEKRIRTERCGDV